LLYYLIIFLIISLIVGLFYRRDNNLSLEGKVIVSLLISFCITGSTFLGVNIYAQNFAESEWVPTYEDKLYAISDNGSIVGRFYLGGGYVNSNLRLYYMVKQNEGFRLYYANDWQSTIIETENTPKVVIYSGRYKNKILRDMAFSNHADHFKFYIPKGSINYQFNIDLK
jgi:hypothetical protein